MNVSKFLSEKNENDISKLRSFLFKNYIKTVIEEHNDDDKDFRIMFIGNRFKSDFNNPISFECNGIIFKYDRELSEFKAVLIPTQLFNNQKLIKSEINKFIVDKSYTIHKVYDGTILNIYYYNNNWRLSTNKAYDSTDLLFINNKTYMDFFNELVEQYKDFSFDKLDKNKCYSVCFKTKEYHPFIENKYTNNEKIIFIQSVNINKFNEEQVLEINTREDIGFPISEEIENNDLNINKLYKTLNNELNRFKKNNKKADYMPIYGYILRCSNYKKTKNYSNILLESNLLSKIRNFVYNYNLRKNLDFYDKLTFTENINVDKSYYDPRKLINLKVFLKNKDVNLFLSLFPEFKKEFIMYNNFLKFLTKYIIKNYDTLKKNIFNLSEIIKDKYKLELLKVVNNEYSFNYIKVNKISILLVNELINNNIDLNVNEKYDILFDYLHNISFIDYYYSCIYK